MTDIVNSKRRSEMMARVRGRDTAPELAVRRIAHRMGFRFRLHRKGLPGRPDLVFPRHRVVVFVHGCFWHRHEGCRYASTPKSRVAFWTEKFTANVARDARQQAALRALGWQVLVIWECESNRPAFVECRLTALLRRERPVSNENSAVSVALTGKPSTNTGIVHSDAVTLGNNTERTRPSLSHAQGSLASRERATPTVGAP